MNNYEVAIEVTYTYHVRINADNEAIAKEAARRLHPAWVEEIVDTPQITVKAISCTPYTGDEAPDLIIGHGVTELPDVIEEDIWGDEDDE